LAPVGGSALSVTGIVQGSMTVTDARRGRRELGFRRELAFPPGTEGTAIEYFSFALTPTEPEDDGCFILFLPFCFLLDLIKKLLDLIF